MASVAADMTVTRADLERDFVEVLESGTRLVGFYRLQRREACAWLEDLFVEPDVIATGQGRRLFSRACHVARDWGCTRLELHSDPNAEGFYLRLGAERIGTVDSRLVPGRTLPWLRFEL